MRDQDPLGGYSGAQSRSGVLTPDGQGVKRLTTESRRHRVFIFPVSVVQEKLMKKLFLIGTKDLKLMFRDRAGLMLMLLAPFLLTLGLGFVTGRFSGKSSGLS